MRMSKWQQAIQIRHECGNTSPDGNIWLLCMNVWCIDDRPLNPLRTHSHWVHVWLNVCHLHLYRWVEELEKYVCSRSHTHTRHKRIFYIQSKHVFFLVPIYSSPSSFFEFALKEYISTEDWSIIGPHGQYQSRILVNEFIVIKVICFVRKFPNMQDLFMKPMNSHNCLCWLDAESWHGRESTLENTWAKVSATTRNTY